MYANVEFTYQGNTYEARGLLGSNNEEIASYVTECVGRAGFHAREVSNLPMKRLAVQCGLAVYGRNNITYVEGMGSNVIYQAFATDIVCSEATWRPMCHASLCDTCQICENMCPTQAIRKEHFLIDNQRCLSCLNESGEPFPDWLPNDVHHTLYDCTRCQEKCPMNQGLDNVYDKTVYLSEEEIHILLAGKKNDEGLSQDFKEKAKLLGLFRWPDGLTKNIRAIINLQDSKREIE